MCIKTKKNKFINRLKYFKKLSFLGVFKSFGLKSGKSNLYYNYYLSHYSNTIYSTSTIHLFRSIYKLYPLIQTLFLKENLFLFINVDNNGGNFMTKFIYSAIKKTKIYCTYDWGFGSLTNFNRIFYNFFIENKNHFNSVPSIVLFLRMFEKQHYIVPEVQRVGSLSIGASDYESSGCIDYPIPINSTLDYSYFFVKFFILLLNNNTSKKKFTKSYKKSYLT